MENLLFSPDIFSRSHPEFRNVPPDKTAEIFSVLNLHYPALAGSVQTIEQLSGLEINSRNYRLSAGSKTFALKHINNSSYRTTRMSQLRLSQQLLDQGVVFPRIIDNCQGTLISMMDDGYPWILAEFVHGDYFSGKKSDFFSIASAIGNLQAHLDSVDPSGIPLSAATGYWNQTSDIIRGLFLREHELDRFFPKTAAMALTREFPLLKTTFQQIADRLPNIRMEIAPTHIDLHPHNILIKPDHTPVFVDVDSIQRADRTQSLAFATYKLARQYVIHERLADSPEKTGADTRRFVDTILENLHDPTVDIRAFPILATAEILRRTGIIIQLNMEKGNWEWNSVLHMHLMALHEIPLLFKEFN